MNRERAEAIHDRAWADYMKAWHKVRAIRGRGAFKAQQAFLDAGDRVRRAQEYIGGVILEESKAAYNRRAA